ncbi:MAG TPA: site-specific integrase [Ktedonobacteraceae bacterium]
MENGKRKYLYHQTQAKAVVALQQANYSKLQGTLKQTRDETMEEFLLNWLHTCIQPRVRERTYQSYHDLITKHLLPTVGHVRVHKLTSGHIQKLYDLKRHENYAPQTIRNIALLLRRALDKACQLQYLFQNVCRTVTLPHVPKANSMRSLTIEQAKLFLTAVKGDPLEALYVLALTTGMRQGELLALKWDDIDLTHGNIQVRHTLIRIPRQGVVLSEPKTPSSRRCIHLTTIALEALKQFFLQQEHAKREPGTQRGNHQWVFCNEEGNPLDGGNLLRRSFRPLLNQANLPAIRFHDLRHSTATLLLALGTHPKIVQELLGHSQISMTLDIYSHVLPTLQERAMTHLNTLLTAQDLSLLS